MVRDLPRHSRLAARTEGQGEAIEPDPETVAYMDRREWNRTDYLLNAAQVNLLGDLLRFVPQWKEGKAPEPTMVGPIHWREKNATTGTKERKPASIEDAMRVFGWQG